jgi:hypothetical protein
MPVDRGQRVLEIDAVALVDAGEALRPSIEHLAEPDRLVELVVGEELRVERKEQHVAVAAMLQRLRQGFGQLARGEGLHEGAQTAEEPAGDARHQREVGDPRLAAISLDAQRVQLAIIGQEEAIERAIVVELREQGLGCTSDS